MKIRLTAAALASAAVVLLPGAVFAGAGGLSVAPAHPDPSNPSSRSYFTLRLAPGATATEQIRVGNDSGTALHVLVNAVDGRTAPNSGAVYADRQDAVTGAGAWVTPSVSDLTVPPGSEQLVDLTVRVPADAAPGDHLGGIAFEDGSPATAGTGLKVTTVVRRVVGVLVQVPGDAAFHVAVFGASVQPLPAGAGPAVVVDLSDDGLLLGKPALTVTLDGPSGYSRTVSRSLDTVLPGDRIPYPLAWPDALAPGDYTVTVSATGPGMSTPVTYRGAVHVDAAIRAPQPAQPPFASMPAQQPQRLVGLPSWVLPALGGAGALLVLATAALLTVLVRARRRRRSAVAARR